MVKGSTARFFAETVYKCWFSDVILSIYFFALKSSLIIWAVTKPIIPNSGSVYQILSQSGSVQELMMIYKIYLNDISAIGNDLSALACGFILDDWMI